MARVDEGAGEIMTDLMDQIREDAQLCEEIVTGGHVTDWAELQMRSERLAQNVRLYRKPKERCDCYFNGIQCARDAHPITEPHEFQEDFT